jgi:Stage II sporulation protein E (SpoIIE)
MLLRLTRFPWLVVVAFLVLGLQRSQAAETPTARSHSAPVLVLNGLGEGLADLDGPWQFQMGDDPAWAAPSFNDSHWAQLTTDQPWGSQGYGSRSGFGWYRKHINIVQAPGASPDIALLIPLIDDAYEVYWNGTLVAKNGAFPPRAFWYFTQPPQTYGLGHIGSGVLAMRVWKAALASSDAEAIGGFEATPVIGSSQAIAARKAAMDFKWLRSSQFEFGIDSLYVLVAVLSFFAWLRDRKQWLLFWMAGYTIIPLVRLILTGLRLPWSNDLGSGLLQPAIMIQDVSLWFLLLWLLKLQDGKGLVRLTRNVAIIFGTTLSIDGIVVLGWGSPHWTSFLQVTDALLTAIFTPLEAVPLIIVAAAVVQRKQLEPSRWLVAICAFFAQMTYVMTNLSGQFKRFTHWTLDEKIRAPLFSVNGNSINAHSLANTLLLIAIVYAVVRWSADERKEQAALEQEFKNAREIQQVLVPDTLPSVPGFTVTSAYRPALQVGGDFFQIIPLEGGSTLVILGDVSGKGLKAAMAVSLIVGAVRALADDYPGPAQLLTQLNRRLCGRMQDGFATCLTLLLRADSTCVLASAGHPAPFLNQHEIDLPGALPLGVSLSATYLQTEFAVLPGDHFALYTDGLLEARSQSGELYGFDRLEGLFANQTNAAEATAAAVNFGQDDDITVLTLTRLAIGEDSKTLHLATTL